MTPERPRTGVVPFLTIRDGRGTEALAFYAAAFGPRRWSATRPRTAGG